MNVTGILENCEKVDNGTKYKIGGKWIKAWVEGRGACETPQDEILSLSNTQVSCDYEEVQKGDKTYNNAVRVEAHAGPTSVPAASTGETMTKADWEAKEDKQREFQWKQTNEVTAREIMCALLTGGDGEINLDYAIAHFQKCYRAVRSEIDGGAEIEPWMLPSERETQQPMSMGTPVEGKLDRKSAEAALKNYFKKQGWDSEAVVKWIQCCLPEYSPPLTKTPNTLLATLQTTQMELVHKAMLQDEIESRGDIKDIS